MEFYSSHDTPAMPSSSSLLLSLLLLLFNLTPNRFLHGYSGTVIRHISHEILHHSQIKHSTQSYAGNEGHTTHNE
jgi:hypothetical protein